MLCKPKPLNQFASCLSQMLCCSVVFYTLNPNFEFMPPDRVHRSVISNTCINITTSGNVKRAWPSRRFVDFLNKFFQTALLVNYEGRKEHKHKN